MRARRARVALANQGKTVWVEASDGMAYEVAASLSKEQRKAEAERYAKLYAEGKLVDEK